MSVPRTPLIDSWGFAYESQRRAHPEDGAENKDIFSVDRVPLYVLHSKHQDPRTQTEDTFLCNGQLHSVAAKVNDEVHAESIDDGYREATVSSEIHGTNNHAYIGENPIIGPCYFDETAIRQTVSTKLTPGVKAIAKPMPNIAPSLFPLQGAWPLVTLGTEFETLVNNEYQRIMEQVHVILEKKLAIQTTRWDTQINEYEKDLADRYRNHLLLDASIEELLRPRSHVVRFQWDGGFLDFHPYTFDLFMNLLPYSHLTDRYHSRLQLSSNGRIPFSSFIAPETYNKSAMRVVRLYLLAQTLDSEEPKRVDRLVQTMCLADMSENDMKDMERLDKCRQIIQRNTDAVGELLTATDPWEKDWSIKISHTSVPEITKDGKDLLSLIKSTAAIKDTDREKLVQLVTQGVSVPLFTPLSITSQQRQSIFKAPKVLAEYYTEIQMDEPESKSAKKSKVTEMERRGDKVGTKQAYLTKEENKIFDRAHHYARTQLWNKLATNMLEYTEVQEIAKHFAITCIYHARHKGFTIEATGQLFTQFGESLPMKGFRTKGIERRKRIKQITGKDDNGKKVLQELWKLQFIIAYTTAGARTDTEAVAKQDLAAAPFVLATARRTVLEMYQYIWKRYYHDQDLVLEPQKWTREERNRFVDARKVFYSEMSTRAYAQFLAVCPHAWAFLMWVIEDKVPGILGLTNQEKNATEEVVLFLDGEAQLAELVRPVFLNAVEKFRKVFTRVQATHPQSLVAAELWKALQQLQLYDASIETICKPFFTTSVVNQHILTNSLSLSSDFGELKSEATENRPVWMEAHAFSIDSSLFRVVNGLDRACYHRHAPVMYPFWMSIVGEHVGRKILNSTTRIHDRIVSEYKAEYKGAKSTYVRPESMDQYVCNFAYLYGLYGEQNIFLHAPLIKSFCPNIDLMSSVLDHDVYPADLYEKVETLQYSLRKAVQTAMVARKQKMEEQKKDAKTDVDKRFIAGCERALATVSPPVMFEAGSVRTIPDLVQAIARTCQFAVEFFVGDQCLLETDFRRYYLEKTGKPLSRKGWKEQALTVAHEHELQRDEDNENNEENEDNGKDDEKYGNKNSDARDDETDWGEQNVNIELAPFPRRPDKRPLDSSASDERSDKHQRMESQNDTDVDMVINQLANSHIDRETPRNEVSRHPRRVLPVRQTQYPLKKLTKSTIATFFGSHIKQWDNIWAKDLVANFKADSCKEDWLTFVLTVYASVIRYASQNYWLQPENAVQGVTNARLDRELRLYYFARCVLYMLSLDDDHINAFGNQWLDIADVKAPHVPLTRTINLFRPGMYTFRSCSTIPFVCSYQKMMCRHELMQQYVLATRPFLKTTLHCNDIARRILMYAFHNPTWCTPGVNRIYSPKHFLSFDPVIALSATEKKRLSAFSSPFFPAEYYTDSFEPIEIRVDPLFISDEYKKDNVQDDFGVANPLPFGISPPDAVRESEAYGSPDPFMDNETHSDLIETGIDNLETL